MQIYNSISEIQFNKNRIITVGSFDGVHRGHAFILNSFISRAKDENLKTLVITFEPHPQYVIGNDSAKNFKILTDKDEKIRLLSHFQIDELLIIPFTKEFSMTSAENFLKNYLVEKIGFTNILTGYDNFFGHNRDGNRAMLEAQVAKFGYRVTETGTYQFKDLTISSTVIRNLLQNCDIETANDLLGYPYSVSGEIVSGNRLGRTLGFPTINIKVADSHKLLPANGVYLTRSYLDNGTFYGMGNIGFRPTLTNDTDPTLEINLFGFSGDAYEKAVQSEFLVFIRQEKKFDNIENLIIQMQNDKKKCAELINKLL